jgi:hypothetical protein
VHQSLCPQHQIPKLIHLLLRVKIPKCVLQSQLPVEEQQRSAGYLFLPIEHAVALAGAPVPIGCERKRKVSLAGIEDFERRQMVSRDRQHIYPQSLEVLVLLAQEHQFFRSDGRKGH